MKHYHIPHITPDGNFFVLEKDALAEIAERDKTIVEQQALLQSALNYIECGIGSDENLPAEIDDAIQNWPSFYGKSALETTLKAERIETLEDAAKWFAKYDSHIGKELRRMTNELREQS